MRRVLLCLLLAGGCAGSSGTVGYRANVHADVYTPDLVYVSPGVQVIADYDEPIFYSDNYYWRYDGGRWYRSHSYRDGWVYATPPRAIARIERPYAYVRYRPHGYVARRPAQRHDYRNDGRYDNDTPRPYTQPQRTYPDPQPQRTYPDPQPQRTYPDPQPQPQRTYPDRPNDTPTPYTQPGRSAPPPHTNVRPGQPQPQPAQPVSPPRPGPVEDDVNRGPQSGTPGGDRDNRGNENRGNDNRGNDNRANDNDRGNDNTRGPANNDRGNRGDDRGNRGNDDRGRDKDKDKNKNR